jgi:hypothetical protein
LRSIRKLLKTKGACKYHQPEKTRKYAVSLLPPVQSGRQYAQVAVKGPEVIFDRFPRRLASSPAFAILIMTMGRQMTAPDAHLPDGGPM